MTKLLKPKEESKDIDPNVYMFIAPVKRVDDNFQVDLETVMDILRHFKLQLLNVFSTSTTSMSDEDVSKYLWRSSMLPGEAFSIVKDVSPIKPHVKGIERHVGSIQNHHEWNDAMISCLQKNDKVVTLFKSSNINDATPNRSQLPNDKDYDSSSKFELCEVLSSTLELLPLSYEHQAILQTASSHLLKLNDFLRAEKMIKIMF